MNAYEFSIYPLLWYFCPSSLGLYKKKWVVALSHSWPIKCLYLSAYWGFIVMKKIFLALCSISSVMVHFDKDHMCCLLYKWAMLRKLHNIMAFADLFCNSKLVYVFCFIVFNDTGSSRNIVTLYKLYEQCVNYAQKEYT